MQAELSTTTTFCDDTELKEEFDTTSIGKLEARDHFFDLRREAEQNMSVIARTPHIIKVVYRHPDIPSNEEPVIEEFDCEHTLAKKAMA